MRTYQLLLKTGRKYSSFFLVVTSTCCSLFVNAVSYLHVLYSFLTRQDFLQRCDVRAYEVDKTARLINSAGGGNTGQSLS